MRLSFIQLSGFSANWKRLKLTDEDLRNLERAIMDAPDHPPVMSGTGGLRKIRFAQAASSSGKSGGLRACYVYFAEFGLVYLCAVFPKNVQANLSAAERAMYRKVLESFKRYLHDNGLKGPTP
jgi:hypothetical protein